MGLWGNLEEEEVSQTGSGTWDCRKIENEAEEGVVGTETQNATDRQTDGRTDRRTDVRTSGQTDKVNPVYPPTTYSGRGV